MKNLKNLNGVKALSKKEQKSINGGRLHCDPTENCFCPSGMMCNLQGNYCVRSISAF